jgi:hypothetical protein
LLLECDSYNNSPAAANNDGSPIFSNFVRSAAGSFVGSSLANMMNNNTNQKDEDRSSGYVG